MTALTKPIVLIGLMGAGKTRVGRLLAQRLDLPFRDADEEIVKAAGCSVEEIFERFGETAFRDGERRVIARLLDDGPQVLATGGGAFIDAETRDRVHRSAISVWLRADLDTLVDRTTGRKGRPLLNDKDHRQVLAMLMAERYPVYAEAEIVVDTCDQPVEVTTDTVLDAVATHLARDQRHATSRS